MIDEKFSLSTLSKIYCQLTGLPLIHFQFLGSSVSRVAPSQYWPLASPRCRRHNSQLRNPCSAGLDSSTSEPPRSEQNVSASPKFLGWKC